MCLDKLKTHSKRPSLVFFKGEESRKENKIMEEKDIPLPWWNILQHGFIKPLQGKTVKHSDVMFAVPWIVQRNIATLHVEFLLLFGFAINSSSFVSLLSRVLHVFCQYYRKKERCPLRSFLWTLKDVPMEWGEISLTLKTIFAIFRKEVT